MTTSGVRVSILGLLIFVAIAVPPAALGQELVQGGDFEHGVDPWTGCDGVDLVDAQDASTTPAMVHAGRFAARIGGPADGSCGSPPASQLVLVAPVVVPADATDLTLSFWFSRPGAELSPQGNSVADLSVSLSTDPAIGRARSAASGSTRTASPSGARR